MRKKFWQSFTFRLSEFILPFALLTIIYLYWFFFANQLDLFVAQQVFSLIHNAQTGAVSTYGGIFLIFMQEYAFFCGIILAALVYCEFFFRNIRYQLVKLANAQRELNSRKIQLNDILQHIRIKFIAYLYLLCIFVFGVLWFAHSWSKEYYQRPRPQDVLEFGGNFQFIPALSRCSTCDAVLDGSFISSHAAVGFMLIALSILSKSRKQKFKYFFLAILCGTILGSYRIIAEKHFVSDVVFAGVFIYIFSWILARILRLNATFN